MKSRRRTRGGARGRAQHPLPAAAPGRESRVSSGGASAVAGNQMPGALSFGRSRGRSLTGYGSPTPAPRNPNGGGANPALEA
jgi:hypothetical protein